MSTELHFQLFSKRSVSGTCPKRSACEVPRQALGIWSSQESSLDDHPIIYNWLVVLTMAKY